MLAAGGIIVPHRAAAQSDTNLTTLTLDVGAEAESYLRYLQTLGEAAQGQWSIRPFGPREVDSRQGADVAYDRLAATHPIHRRGLLLWQVLPVEANLWYNSAFPFGENDGAVWRGRGATGALSGGVALRYGVLSLELEPLAFLAQNSAFPLMANGRSGGLAFGDALRPRNIDRPQRFGTGTYGAIDPGQSTLRIDAFGLAAGLSTANQWWGPMSEWPYLLSNNAAGFPHLFVGTSRPASTIIGRFHGRVIYGRLDQSAYTDITGTASRRFVGGVVGSWMPRGLDGLEIGVARLFESPWPAGGIGWRELRKPFEAVLKNKVAGDPGESSNGSADNQLASLFARWVFAGSGSEIYGEYGREDHSWDTIDLLQEPDHAATLGLGMRKAWRRDDGGLSGVRVELFDLDPSALGRHRGEGLIYTHSDTRQGHTQRGQVLGAGFAAINGMGAMIAYDRYGPDNRKLALSLSRRVVRERAASATIPGMLDVQYALSAERTRPVGWLRVTYGVTGVYEMNRYFASDKGNLLASVRLGW